MNIALINPEFPTLSGKDHGGIATYTYNMANALVEQGCQVHVLAKEHIIPDSLDQRINFHNFKHEHIKNSILAKKFNKEVYWERGWSLGLRNKLLELHAQNHIDIVEIAEYNALAYELKKMPFPIVITFHTPTQVVDNYNNTIVTRQRKKWYAFEKKATKNASAFKCPSKSLAKIIEKEWKIKESQIEHILYPMPTTDFKNIKKINVENENRIDILFSGRLEVRKGAQIILNVINDILDLDERINITFAGETESESTNSYRSAIERILLPRNRKRVWFLGSLERAEVLVLYKRSNAIFIPSVFDNQPNVLLEAMSAGIPIITANTGGINEIIINDYNGMLFELNNPDTIIACFKRMITFPEECNKYVENAYDDIKKKFFPSKIASQNIEFYSNVIKLSQ